MTFGLTTDGFNQKTLADLKTELENALRASFGNSIDLSPQSVLGQLVGVYADRLADLWSLGGSIHAAFTPDGASGTSLRDLCAITGTVEHPAAQSQVRLTLGGTPGTTILANSVVTVGVAGTRFVNLADTLLVAATAWVTSTVYAVGDAITRVGNIYVCVVQGTSSAGPSGTGTAIVDGTCTWRYLCAGTGVSTFTSFVSESTGPLAAVAYSLNTIGSPVSGWAGAINVLDAVPGRNLETDAELRVRREFEIRTAGKASLDAIRAALLEVTDVTGALVAENPTDSTDVNGVPPHAIECLVIGGTDDDVAASIFDEKAAGIATYGSTSVTVLDSGSQSHTVSFSRPTAIPIYVVLNLTVDATLWPVDGAAQVKAAVVAWGNAQLVGKDVVSAAIVAQAFRVVGLLDGAALIGTAPAPTLPTTVAIGVRQLATYDTSRITVNVVTGTP